MQKEAAYILVVDDDPTNRRLLEGSLKRNGYHTSTAANGAEALESVKLREPDLILLDVMMPDQSGIEVCQKLKADDATASIPVIFVTALSATSEIVEGFEAGGSDFITKPFRPAEVLARVNVHVRLRQAETELLSKNREMEQLTGMLKKTNRELETLSRTDPLTQLLNRRTWEQFITNVATQSEIENSPYSIIMVDVDYFKSYNDTQGHQAGDECLKKIADALTIACRKTDHIGRYGGEEFVVLAPETVSHEAVRLAERIRQTIWSMDIHHPANSVTRRITASFGVATATGNPWEPTLKLADDALYISKKAGRNMVYAGNHLITPVNKPAANPVNVQETRSLILVVDDEPTNRTICRVGLQNAGYDVIEAENGKDAIEKARKEIPDVIIMDVMMPEMDGFQSIQELRSIPETHDIPIVILSALDSGDKIMTGLQAGADEYLTKPIRTDELVLRVRSMVRLRREHTDLMRSYEVRGEHVRILMGLVDFCRYVGNCIDIEGVLRTTAETVADILFCRKIALLLVDDEHKWLRSGWIHCDGDIAPFKVPLGEGVAGSVFANGQPVLINSEKELSGFDMSWEQDFLKSCPILSVPLGTTQDMVGVIHVCDRIGSEVFDHHELEYIEMVSKIAGSAIENLMERGAKEQAADSIMAALAELAEHRDNETGLHLDRVTEYCLLLARTLRKEEKYKEAISDEFLYDLERSVPLHDIGKVAIPDNILLHPGHLDEQQMAIMRTHTIVGARTIRSLIDRSPGVSFLRMAADIANYHHEWWDGTGYPVGLKGEEIPLSARITALADVYDALTTRRVYKEPVPHDKTTRILLNNSGTQFDPDITEAFLECESMFEKLSLEMVDDVSETPVKHHDTQVNHELEGAH